ncbi:hypothetical protein ABID26_000362 [Mesorhizobium shonense]|uniref:Uncharacterized protein n=1 Tax=Mesorhizobium shonense TaxID=1209948 RepID=A0ABV2HKB3_9HYPH
MVWKIFFGAFRGPSQARARQPGAARSAPLKPLTAARGAMSTESKSKHRNKLLFNHGYYNLVIL